MKYLFHLHLKISLIFPRRHCIQEKYVPVRIFRNIGQYSVEWIIKCESSIYGKRFLNNEFNATPVCIFTICVKGVCAFYDCYTGIVAVTILIGPFFLKVLLQYQE